MNGCSEDLLRLLSDPTRMKIYRSVADARGKTITVSDVAEKFDLHPNVARMHLEKLAAAGLLASDYKKTGGGRPARQYTIGERELNLQIPARDYKMLADISLSVIADDSRARLKAKQKGHEIGQRALAKAGPRLKSAKVPELVSFLEELVQEMGLNAQITSNLNGKLEMSFYNCVFKELSNKDSKVCTLHRNVFVGICESILGKVRVSGKPGISEGENCCNFQISFCSEK